MVSTARNLRTATCFGRAAGELPHRASQDARSECPRWMPNTSVDGGQAAGSQLGSGVEESPTRNRAATATTAVVEQQLGSTAPPTAQKEDKAKYLTKGQRRRMRKQTSEGEQRVREVLRVCRLRRPVLLEVFAGMMTLTRVAQQRGWRTLEPVESTATGGRIGDVAFEKLLWQAMAKHKPDLITLAPDCSAFSPLQNLNKNTPEARARLEEKRRRSKPQWKFAKQVLAYQRRAGKGTERKLAMENPCASRAWKT